MKNFLFYFFFFTENKIWHFKCHELFPLKTHYYFSSMIWPIECLKLNMSHNVKERTVGHTRPAKIQISLRIRAVWSESSLGAFRIAKDANLFLHVRGQWRLWSDCADAQADLSLRWEHTPEGGFSLVATQMSMRQNMRAKLSEDVSSGICVRRRPRSACSSTQSDHNLRCPLTIIWY